MDTLYVKTSDGLVEINLGTSGGGSSTSVAVVRDRKTLAEVLPSGTPYEVPGHSLGSDGLVVFFNGLLCSQGEDQQYVDLSRTSIKFNFDLPIGSEIDVIQFDDGG